MKALKNCPHCSSSFNEHLVASWFEQYCTKGCSMDYRQFLDKSYDDENIKYNKFYTDHFFDIRLL